MKNEADCAAEGLFCVGLTYIFSSLYQLQVTRYFYGEMKKSQEASASRLELRFRIHHRSLDCISNNTIN